MSNPKVTVSLITYNHAGYIAQALQGALSQQTDFDFEILIGEDGSTDGTREIAIACQKKFPERIRVLLNDRKNVSYANGKPTGNWNLANNIRNARGQYIALLDGDDYWTSPLKLQKQADFLGQNPGFALCYHNVLILDESDPEKRELHEKNPGPKTLRNLLRGNFMHTCSVMFRAGLFPKFPAWYFSSAFGDWPLHILNAQHGDIGYLDEVLGVYRKHGQGAIGKHGTASVFEATIQSAELLRDCLSPADQKYLDKRLARWYRKLLGCYDSDRNREAWSKAAGTYLDRFPAYKNCFGLKLLLQTRLRALTGPVEQEPKKPFK
jgi:glycosyltransferase involved in cell wall biosynthesis